MYKHPRAAFDGLHAIKIKDSLELDPHLVAVIAPQVDEKGGPLVIESPPKFADRVIRLDHREHYGLRQWSDAVFETVKEYMSNQPHAGDG